MTEQINKQTIWDVGSDLFYKALEEYDSETCERYKAGDHDKLSTEDWEQFAFHLAEKWAETVIQRNRLVRAITQAIHDNTG